MRSGGTASQRGPQLLAGAWLLTASLSALTVPAVLLTVPGWHRAIALLHTVSGVQTWISIAACVALLMLSKRKHAENQEEWAQGALLIYVLGGLLTAVLLHYGIWPQWLAQSVSLAKQAQMLALLLAHWCCAWITWRLLRRNGLAA